MIDVAEALLRSSASVIVTVGRVLLWLGWDLCVETIGWSVGWLLLRVITFGRFPEFPFRGADDAAWWYALIVEMLGLATLAVIVLVLSGYIG